MVLLRQWCDVTDDHGLTWEQTLRDTADFNYLMAHVVAQMPPLRFLGIEIEVRVCHDAPHNGRTFTPEHEHPFYEMSFMHVGEMRYFCDEHAVVINTENRRIFFMPPATLHHRHTDSPISVIASFQLGIHACEPCGNAFVYHLPELIRRHGFDFGGDEDFEYLARRWRSELLARRVLAEERIALMIHQFLLTFFQKYFASALAEIRTSSLPALSRSSRNIYMRDLIEKTVNEWLNRPVRLEDISQSCGISPRQLNRIFNETDGISLGNYIIHRKVLLAKKMLRENTMLIKDIAAALGYQDVSYFCRIFKKTTGFSPYRFARLKPEEQESTSS